MYISIQDAILKIIGYHSQLPYPEKMTLKRFRTKMKQRVVKETTSIIKIYEEIVVSQMPPQTLAIMPITHELCKGIISLAYSYLCIINFILKLRLTYVSVKMTPNFPDSSMFDIPERY